MTPHQIEKGIEKYKLSDYENLSMNPDGWYEHLYEDKRLFNDFLVFNQDGLNIMPLDTISCSADYLPFASTFIDDPKVKVNKNLSWAQFQKRLCTLEGQPYISKQSPEKYHVVVIWTLFTGKLNRDYIPSVSESLEVLRRKGYDIELLYVNLDPQDNWPDSVKTKIHFIKPKIEK